MEPKEFIELTKTVYNRIFDAFDSIDPDEAEADQNLDNVSISFANGTTFVINRQSAVQQIWLATNRVGLHFSYQEGSQSWTCDKTGQEFFKLLSESVSQQMQQTIQI